MRHAEEHHLPVEIVHPAHGAVRTVRRRERLRRTNSLGERALGSKRSPGVRASHDAGLSPKQLGDDPHCVGRRRARVEDTRTVRHGRHHERPLGTKRFPQRANHAEGAIIDGTHGAKGRVNEQHTATLYTEMDQLFDGRRFGHGPILVSARSRRQADETGGASRVGRKSKGLLARAKRGTRHVKLRPMSTSLKGKIALVAGATRGAGRGIAVQLGAAGATVYVTGRTTRSQRSEMNRPETIEETAALVDVAGGRGIAVQVDHLVPDQVRALVARIEGEQGALHVLVNDIWGATRMEWNKSVWESSLDYGLRTLRLGVDTHAITSHFALPLLIKNRGGLVVEVTDGTNAYNDKNYRVSFFYDLAKAAVNRMAFALAHELAPHGSTALSLTPGWLRSEAMLDVYGVTEANWHDATKRQPHFAITESPAFVGRAVAALAQDPDVHRFNGQSLSSGELAKVYGFTDLDGSQPDAWRYLVEVQDQGKPADVSGYR
jgi:NAD(P)-dependent dehydrogenase (short-subunit alcohol dehydrogenase family)